MGDQPIARPLPNTNTEQTQTGIHALSGFRARDPSVRAGEDISFAATVMDDNRERVPLVRYYRV
jgi:hypothetical protein